MEHDMKQILAYVEKAYGTGKEPHFHFVSRSILDRPYEPIVQEFHKLGEVVEDTDPNDDVSFGYLITAQEGSWRVSLSMVGPFALVQRLTDAAAGRVVGDLTTSDGETERRIVEALRKHGFDLINADDLQELLGLGGRQIRLYQALFTDSDALPTE